MKFSKVLFFFAFFIAVKLFNPCKCNDDLNSEQAVPVTSNLMQEDNALEQIDQNLEKKKKKERAILISSISTGIALALGSAIGLIVYFGRQSNEGNQGNEVAPENEANAESEEKEN